MDKGKAITNSSPRKTINNSPQHKSKKATASGSSGKTIANSPQYKNEREKLIEMDR